MRLFGHTIEEKNTQTVLMIFFSIIYTSDKPEKCFACFLLSLLSKITLKTTGVSQWMKAFKNSRYIGCAWSKQFGPIEDLHAAEIEINKEQSLDSIQGDFAVNAGIALGGQSIAGPMREVVIEGGGEDKTELEVVEIITPVSLADIPFEPEISYITEALRLKNFRLKKDKAAKAGINVSADAEFGAGTATAQVGTKSKTGTEGDGLVVAYKLHTINQKSYDRDEPIVQSLALNRSLDFPEANIVVNAKLHIIEPGSDKSLPGNILWACEYAEAKSRDIVAAWVVDIKSLDPRKKSLSIGFPGYPEFDGCRNYSGVIYSQLDPLTEKIHRQKINIAVIDAKLSDTLKSVKWDCTIFLINESFNIKLVSLEDLQN